MIDFNKLLGEFYYSPINSNLMPTINSKINNFLDNLLFTDRISDYSVLYVGDKLIVSYVNTRILYQYIIHISKNNQLYIDRVK